MQRRRAVSSGSSTPMRPIKIVIEDAGLASSGVPLRAPRGVDLCICSGPSSDHEICPLVTDRACPFGPCDVVVSSLDGPWAESVDAAWRATGVPVTSVDGEHLGAAYQALYRASFGGDADA